jgi:GNAT superfamily N-acetyltransferase
VTAGAVATPAGLVRLATENDNQALIELAAACPMEGDLSLRIDRAPDFFALNRLEGDRWKVGVIDGEHGRPIACVATAERRAWMHGRPVTLIYAGDLKVHPEHRGTRAADALERFVGETARETAGESTPILLTVLAGNRSMERRATGPRGLPRLRRFATLRSFAIPLLWRRDGVSPPDLRIAIAAQGDLEEMADLWTTVAPTRQCCAALDAETLARWIHAAPGLEVEDYLLARDRQGRLLGFVGMWDQRAMKTLRVLRYSATLSILRGVVSVVAPFVGATAPPAIGEPLHHASAVHLCVPLDRADVLRALVLAAYDHMRGEERVFVSVALDTRERIIVALDGLLAAPTDIHAYVTMPSGEWAGAALDDRPLHFETALV